jgi:uncharacterized protein YggU (UPF0235/DUF167 family)
MKIFLKVKTGAKEEKIEKIDDSRFFVSVKERPIRGAANEAIIKSLAKYFDVSSNRIKIIAGHKAKQKIVEIG